MPPTDPVVPPNPPLISTHWQLAHDAAVRYQDVVVPWILGPFAEALVEVLGPQPGESILDVGCGSGAATRAVALAVGHTGRVVGLDLNAGMLDVALGVDQDLARGVDQEQAGGQDAPARAPIAWLEASAMDMPLADRSFDAVVSGQVLQFVPDIGAAAREIRRVLKPRGRVALSVWRGTAHNPYFAAQMDAVTARLGTEAAGALVAGFRMADPQPLVDALTDAGFEAVAVRELDLPLDLPPLADWALRHLAATPVASALAGAAPGIGQELGADVARALRDYVTPDGVRVLFSTWVIEGRVGG